MGTSILHIKTEVECKVFLFDEEKGIATPGRYFNLEVHKGEQELQFVCTDDEYYQYHLLYNVEELDRDYNIVIKKDYFVSTHELLTAKASDEEIANGIADEFGVVYSYDGLHLLKYQGYRNLGHYQVRQGCMVIRDWAFTLNSISSISLPNTITHIGSYAFGGCKNLTSITLPSSLIHIGTCAFIHTHITFVISNSSSFLFENGLLIDVKYKKILSFLSLSTDVTIPSYIKSIGDDAFLGTAISSVALNNGLTSIGKYSFLHCIRLRDITFPPSLKNVGYGAFSETKINKVTNLSPYIDYIKGCLIDKNSKSLVACFANDKMIELPKGITHIGSSAFGGNKIIEAIVVPEGVTTIENYAFSKCDNLTSVTFPSSLLYIGSNVFDLCLKLARVNLPKGLEHVDQDAFRCCGSASFSICIPLGTKALYEDLLPEYLHTKFKEQLTQE